MTATFDSLSAVEFANVVGKRFGLQLPGTLLFDYPTMQGLAQHIYAQVVPAGTAFPREQHRCATTAQHMTAPSLDAVVSIVRSVAEGMIGHAVGKRPGCMAAWIEK